MAIPEAERQVAAAGAAVAGTCSFPIGVGGGGSETTTTTTTLPAGGGDDAETGTSETQHRLPTEKSGSFAADIADEDASSADEPERGEGTTAAAVHGAGGGVEIPLLLRSFLGGVEFLPRRQQQPLRLLPAQEEAPSPAKLHHHHQQQQQVPSVENEREHHHHHRRDVGGGDPLYHQEEMDVSSAASKGGVGSIVDSDNSSAPAPAALVFSSPEESSSAGVPGTPTNPSKSGNKKSGNGSRRRKKNLVASLQTALMNRTTPRGRRNGTSSSTPKQQHDRRPSFSNSSISTNSDDGRESVSQGADDGEQQMLRAQQQLLQRSLEGVQERIASSERRVATVAAQASELRSQLEAALEQLELEQQVLRDAVRDLDAIRRGAASSRSLQDAVVASRKAGGDSGGVAVPGNSFRRRQLMSTPRLQLRRGRGGSFVVTSGGKGEAKRSKNSNNSLFLRKRASSQDSSGSSVIPSTTNGSTVTNSGSNTEFFDAIAAPVPPSPMLHASDDALQALRPRAHTADGWQHQQSQSPAGPTSQTLSEPQPVRVLKRCESASYMRICDLKGVAIDHANNDGESSNDSTSRQRDNEKGLCSVDTNVTLLLNELNQLGYNLATDESDRFSPVRDTAKVLTQEQQRQQGSGDGMRRWPIRPWQAAPRNGDVLVWVGSVHHEFHGHDWPVVKARARIQTSPLELVELLLDSSRVHTYNSMSKGRDDVLVIQDGIDTTAEKSPFGFAGSAKIMRSLVKPRWLPKAIETLSLCNARELEGNDDTLRGSYMIVSRSVWEDSAGNDAQQSSHLRNEMLLGVSLIRPVDGVSGGCCELTSITHVYPQGVPEAMAKRMAPSQAASMIRDLQQIFIKK